MNFLGIKHPALGISLLVIIVTTSSRPVSAAALEFEVFSGTKSGISESSVLVKGRKDAVLIDSQWALSDGERVAEQIAKSGRRLTHILITHGHPDHYWGLAPIIKRFPDAKILAREAIRLEIATQFYSKWVHWQPLFPDDIPNTPVVPTAFDGDSITLEGHEIRFIDMPPAETMDATVFYIPSAKAIVAGDLVFSKMHSYFADLNYPKGWVEALELIKSVGPIETVYPGHGPVGGPELIDEAIQYMQTYMTIAKPGVPLQEIVKGMKASYPDHGGELILWWTRGPGFGIFGPRSLGVPEDLLAQLPPHLVGDAPGCRVDRQALVEKLFFEGFSGGHMNVLDEVMHADIAFSDPAFPPGLEGIKALVGKNNTSFEDWGFKMLDVLCDGAKVVVRWQGTGKHVASFMGEKPTNKRIELNGISIYLIENNKITADWVVPDNLGFLMQIGVVAPIDMTE